MNQTSNLSGLDPADFVSLAEYSDIHFVPNDFTNHLKKIAFASSPDDSRHNLNGIRFEMEPGTNTLTMVATDGHRLAISTIPSLLPITKGFTLPRKAAEELIRLVKPEDSNLNIDISDKTLTVSTTHSTIQMRLLDGDYPNWKKVIPTTPPTTITLNKKEFISSIRRVQVFTTDQNKGIIIAISPNEMILSASHPDLGTGDRYAPH